MLEFHEQGVTIIMSTHQMHQVEEFRIFYALTGHDALPNPMDSNDNGVPDECESACVGDFDLSGRHVGIDRILGPGIDLALDRQHVLRIQTVQQFHRLCRSPLRIERELNEARPVAQVEKHHPSQVAPANEMWAPSADDIDHAERVIAAFDEAVPRLRKKRVKSLEQAALEVNRAEVQLLPRPPRHGQVRPGLDGDVVLDGEEAQRTGIAIDLTRFELLLMME